VPAASAASESPLAGCSASCISKVHESLTDWTVRLALETDQVLDAMLAVMIVGD
jgi:hypothetical protein